MFSCLNKSIGAMKSNLQLVINRNFNLCMVMFVNVNTSKTKMFILTRFIVSFQLSISLSDVNLGEKKKPTLYHFRLLIPNRMNFNVYIGTTAISAVTKLVQCVLIAIFCPRLCAPNISLILVKLLQVKIRN